MQVVTVEKVSETHKPVLPPLNTIETESHQQCPVCSRVQIFVLFFFKAKPLKIERLNIPVAQWQGNGIVVLCQS